MDEGGVIMRTLSVVGLGMGWTMQGDFSLGQPSSYGSPFRGASQVALCEPRGGRARTRFQYPLHLFDRNFVASHDEDSSQGSTQTK
jgi:hypothetical protein